MGLVALFRTASADDFELRDVRILEFVSRKAVAVLGSQSTADRPRQSADLRAPVQTLLDADSAPNTRCCTSTSTSCRQINDAFGFHAGDEVIHRVGDVLRRAVSVRRLASRVGGDRFAVFLQREQRRAWHRSQQANPRGADPARLHERPECSVPVSVEHRYRARLGNVASVVASSARIRRARLQAREAGGPKSTRVPRADRRRGHVDPCGGSCSLRPACRRR